MTDGIVIRPYDPGMSDAALRLESQSPQGEAFRLRFDRRYFHRRAENFAEWRMVTAWRGKQMVGVAGAALKDGRFNGRPVKTAYFFDVRVASEERRSRIAQQMIEAHADWVVGQVDLTYGYTVGDNRAAQRLTSELFGHAVTPACRFLAYPVPKRPRRPDGFESADGSEIHRRYLAATAEFDLYFDPTELFGTAPHVGSWAWSEGTRSAGASAWSNAGIMEEVVDGLPPALEFAARLSRLPALDRVMPRLPLRGETIRSWYLFDAHSSDGPTARKLLRGIAAEARQSGIDYLYVIHHGDEPWIDSVRADTQRMFAPVVPYSIVGGAGDRKTPLTIRRPYIDVRDI